MPCIQITYDLTELSEAYLTFSWRKSIDLQSKSMDWFLYNKDLRHEKVKTLSSISDRELSQK